MSKLTITVKKIEREKKDVNWHELPRGTVVQLVDGIKAIVCAGLPDWNPYLLILAYSDGSPYFGQAIDTESYRVEKVLGAVTNIDVEGVI